MGRRRSGDNPLFKTNNGLFYLRMHASFDLDDDTSRKLTVVKRHYAPLPFADIACLYEDLCARSRYQGRREVITFHIICAV